MIRSRPGRTLAAGAWVGALLAAVVGLLALGTGSLSTPPVFDGAALRGWLDERGAVVAAFALLRLVGLALAGYLLVVTLLGLLARLSRIPALVTAMDVATVPAVRRALGTLAGVSLTASALGIGGADVGPGSTAGTAVVAGVDGPVTLQRSPDGADVILRQVPPVAPSAVTDGRATMGVEPDAAPSSARDHTATMRVDDPRAEAVSAGEWTVAPGDHLWSVAEATLARARDRPPTEAEVAPYWRAVVEANRSRLVDPANPDLIRPGQVLALPPVPAPGAG